MKEHDIIILGLGIGQVYREQAPISASVITVDKNENLYPTYTSFEDLLRDPQAYRAKLGIVCLPNFLHEQGIKVLQSLEVQNIIVEKPGLPSVSSWLKYATAQRRFGTLMMAKNNYYRTYFDKTARDYPRIAKRVKIVWENDNRIPWPGHWFTNKEMSWGGVSVDLLPHLMHIAFRNFIPDINRTDNIANHVSVLSKSRTQNYKLAELENTKYGEIKRDGVFNVDDSAQMMLEMPGCIVDLSAKWHGGDDKFYIEILTTTGETERFNLGPMCPNYAYGNMVEAILNNTSAEFRKMQEDMDVFVLQQLMDDKW